MIRLPVRLETRSRT